jgi:hypothetical protein
MSSTSADSNNLKFQILGLDGVGQWQGSCLACTKPWGWSPTKKNSEKYTETIAFVEDMHRHFSCHYFLNYTTQLFA